MKYEHDSDRDNIARDSTVHFIVSNVNDFKIGFVFLSKKSRPLHILSGCNETYSIIQ